MGKSITATLLFLCLLLAVWSGSAQADTFIHTERSPYRNIYVSEDDGTRCIRFNTQSNTVLSCIELKSPDTILFDCNKMMMGALYVHPNPRKILMVGMGGATLTTALSRILPNAEMDVVEIDPAMVRVAREYFNFHPTAKTRISIEDGRVFVKRAFARGEKYDLIVLDAFDERYIPAHMMTLDFLREVRKVLAHDGVLAANTYRTAGRYDSESATYQAVFGTFFNLKNSWKKTRVIIAKQGELPSEEVLSRNARALEPKFAKFGVHSSWLLPLFSTEQDWDDKARLFTDWFMPY
ncbi:MAG TPA: fused MFS/spermidine synthase [Geomonas sp.]|nr:fused MFS/spermidine synthase [Geomonas sp.]